MCAAFDPSGALIVCGGGQRFWRPNNNCWQLVKVMMRFRIWRSNSFTITIKPPQGFHSNWTEIPNIYPVHGAATAFYRCALLLDDRLSNVHQTLGIVKGYFLDFPVKGELWHYREDNMKISGENSGWWAAAQGMTAMITPSLTKFKPTGEYKKI